MRKVRGYSGWYNGVYLRSFLEFAYAYYLDSKGIKWKYETEIFDLNGTSYKPDFIINDGETEYVVEVKGEGNKETGKKKSKLLSELYGINVHLVLYKDLVRIYQTEMPLRLNTLKKKWINEFGAVLIQKVDGENNPMYGKRHSDYTKRLISEKARTPTRIKIASRNGKNLVEWNRKNNFIHARKPRSERETRNCLLCGKQFIVTVKSTKRYCCREHSAIAAFSKATEVYVEGRNKELLAIRNKVIQWAQDNKDIIRTAKYNKISTVLKPLFEEIEREYGIKDKRTITKAVLGEYKGRKELLKYLKTLTKQPKMYADHTMN